MEGFSRFLHAIELRLLWLRQNHCKMICTFVNLVSGFYRQKQSNLLPAVSMEYHTGPFSSP